MITTQFHKDNHYLAQGYLKQWESSHGKTFVFRKLISHNNVPEWVEKSIKGIAFYQHLYTRNIAGNDSDEIERWFDQDFESPAKNSIHKAVTNQRLSSMDWYALVRFLALQDVRTPARLLEHLENSPDTISKVLDNVLKEAVPKMETASKLGIILQPKQPSDLGFPLRITTQIADGEKFGTLKAETAVGRASWLWEIQHSPKNTARVLHQHRWTLMRPAEGMNWFTSDKPVLRLNYYNEGHYDFRGGWGNNGSELIFPLGTQHLMYTRIGYRPPNRGTRFSVEQTILLRRLIAQHSYRMIFAQQPEDISEITPRRVNPEELKRENELWGKWHREQTESERVLLAAR